VGDEGLALPPAAASVLGIAFRSGQIKEKKSSKDMIVFAAQPVKEPHAA